ncbi:MAG: FadR/GntR family transcriptional regulator [Pseudomonadota bacterium]
MSTTREALAGLRALISDPAAKPGDRLPPERDLAPKIGVGRSTLRKALAILEAEGAVHRGVGQGTFVGQPKSDTPDAPALVLEPSPSPADLLEARLMLEPQIAASAAMRATQNDIDRMRKTVDGGSRATDWRAWDEWDSAFHRLIAEASRNPLLVGLISTLTAGRAQRDWGRLRRDMLTTERQRLSSEQHRSIVDAIADRDGPGAAQIMTDHLQAVATRMTATTAPGPISTGGLGRPAIETNSKPIQELE